MALSAISLASALASEGQELVRHFIDTVLVDLLDQLSLPPSDAQPSITLRSRPRQTKCVINPRNGALEAGHCNESSYRSYSWPGNTAYESWKFSMGPSLVISPRLWDCPLTEANSNLAVIIRVLAIVDQALRTGQLISKR